MSKPTVWRWQQAYMNGVVERLLKDRGKGARAGKKPHSAEVRLAIVTRTAKKKPKQATHWSAPMPTFSANFGSMESLKGDLELEAMLLPDARRGRVTDADLLSQQYCRVEPQPARHGGYGLRPTRYRHRSATCR